jgi:hypothetical protein
VRIAVTAPPTFRDEDSLVGLGEIVEHLAAFVVVDNRSDWNFDFQILAVAAVTSAALTMPAAIGAKSVVVTKFQKGVFVAIGDQVNVAAVTAVAAARTTSRYKFLATKGDAAVSPIARFDCDFCFVDEQLLFDRLDRDEPSGCALVLKLHNARNLCEQRVVFADTDVQAGLELGAALPDQDGSTCDEFPGKPLYTQPLRVAVAAVTRTADAFFMSHNFP